MSALMAEDFRVFFQELYGYEPYPWQERLVRRVLTEGWPEAIDLPTGSGKTAVLDVAIFTLAAQASLSPQQRATGLRIFYVVDRRIVVDTAEQRAQLIARRLQERIETGKEDVLGRVARALMQFGGRRPLQVVKLRGGMYRQQRWIEAPNQPTVCLTTVDQIGSRLLFRGYGVSPYQWSLHAGLAGCDALYLLDEAHMSWPFLETLRGVREYLPAEIRVAPPPKVVAMSATLPAAVRNDVFQLEAEDLETEELARRLKAHKPTRLVEVRANEFDEAMVRFALELAEQPDIQSVAVIVNRVSRARRIASRLQSEVGEQNVLLLTGRIRPYDRDRLLERLNHDGLPRFVVATQTIEVGADLDFDAIVTELAPMDALRQRFGRLNRKGRKEEAPAVIVCRLNQNSSRYNPDERDAAPYAPDELKACWQWLKKHARKHKGERVLDFGAKAMADLLANGNAPLPTPKRAPLLLPAIVERWVMTHPTPDPDPDVAPFLHGIEARQVADVQVVWRADIEERDLNEGRKEYIEDLLTLVPPLIHEMLPVPVWAVRQWLSNNEDSGEVSDIEGTTSNENNSSASSKGRKAFLWRGPGESKIVNPSQIRPGDTLVVPASYGGVDRFGWNPDRQKADPNDDSPIDVYELGLWRATAPRFFFRLHPAVIGSLVRLDMAEKTEELRQRLQQLLQELDTLNRPAVITELRALLEELCEIARPEWAELLEHVKEGLGKSTQWQPYPERNEGTVPDGLLVRVLASPARVDAVVDKLIEDPVSDELEEESLWLRDGKQRSVSLREHSDRVEQYAQAFAMGCGLSEPLVQCLKRAARFHDLGKAEPRMQVLLHGGDEVAAVAAEEPLAKSGLPAWDHNTRRLVYGLAGYPRGLRHEFISVGLLTQHHEALTDVEDPDLVLFLVGTHHGRGRPFVLPVDDPNPQTVEVELYGYCFQGSSAHGLDTLSSGWVERFWYLIRRYGPWGLAYLEAILRLADHRASEEEAQS